ncbi:hypothetical protein L1987_77684 [Smallanthus sonchifolius]|uniref:Uncharacterized protein n=1 Tax=Smallanthus sonchifolius TaxID=185202 RepID=A0ACB8ZAK4_9ASTR|nr:hypothetical protein L1987_77684 [Smallanthus sonchifolius]
MVKLRATEYLSLRSTFVLCVILFLKIESSLEAGITVIESAVAKGAVCLDGTPPAYQLDRGFGDGVNNWLVHIQGGGWCHTIENCVVRKTLSYGFGSSELMPELNFTGLLSNQQDQNPNFYNWNRVYMRYCDGASFTGDVEEIDPCFFPQYDMPYINTPIFIVNSAYDTWQFINTCVADFRSDYLWSLWSVFAKSSTEGIFINTCYTHCQTDSSTWFANATSKLGDKTIAEAVGDWFYDKNEFQIKIDIEHVNPHYC